jgi:hypothetical protein
MLSHRLKGKWSPRRRQGFHSTPLHHVIYPSPSLRITLHFGIILHSYIICQRGREFEKGSYFTHKYLFLAIHAKGGESISPKQKDRTTTNFKKMFKYSLSIYIKEVFQLVSYFWDNFKLVWPLSKLISKTLLNTKRRISLRGSFV